MGLVGEGAIVTGVLPDVFPTLELEDVPGELYKLANWDIAVGSESLSPGAAARATIGLENPVDSGKIAVLTRLRFQPDLLMAVTVGWLAIPSGLVVNGVNRLRDGRQASFPNAQPVCFVGSNNTSPINAAWDNFLYQPEEFGGVFDNKGHVVLTPGTAFACRGGTNNVLLRCAIEWRERPVDSSELIL